MQPTLPLIPITTTTMSTTVEPLPEATPEPTAVQVEPVAPSPRTEVVAVEPLVTLVTPAPGPLEVAPELELAVVSETKLVDEEHPYMNMNGLTGVDIDEEYRRASIVLEPALLENVGVDEQMRHPRSLRRTAPLQKARFLSKYLV